MSDLNVIVLSPAEKPIVWLNSDTLNITYTEEWDKIPSISIECPISEDNNDYTEIFKQGNKIYVGQTPTTRPRLYVINEEYELDLWKENTITVTAEDAITELNYVEPFYYAGNEKIEVTQSFLEEVFQPYWNITKYHEPLDSSLKYIHPCGSMTKMSLLRLIEEETGNVFVWWYIKNKDDNRIVRHLDFIKPSHRGYTRKSVLDVGYNMDNIQYSVSETNTYKAMAPILKMSETTVDTSTSTTSGATGTTGMSRDEMQKILNGWADWKPKETGDINPYGWLDLAVKKGETIPCSVEKYTENSNTGSDATAINESKEYYRILSYWKAPFDKNKGDFFIFDNSDTDVNYTKIEPHQIGGDIVPKIGTVSSNNIHKYAIYADCANQLIQQRYPDVELKVTASDLDSEITPESSFNVYDKVWIRLEGYKQLIFARITKTVKNLQDPSKNKITVSNIKIGSKIEQKGTFFVVDDCKVKQGAGEYFKGTLHYYEISNAGDITAYPLKNTVMSITVIKKDEQVVTSSEVTETGSTGGGFDRLGISADKTQIMAIGKPSAVGESHYGYKYYKSVFKRKCPFCGSTDLIWAWHWASGNCGHLPDYTRFYTKCGSIEGHIFCRSCDADFSCIDGKDHMSPPRATLTRVSGPVASSEAEAQSLKDGKMANSATATGNKNVTASVESIMAKARGFRYGGNASSININDAKILSKNQEAHDYVEKYHQCDCFGMTAYLFIEFKNAGYKVRAVKYYSQYAGSGTHRTVQIWQNNDWVDPSYAGYDTRFKAMKTKKDFVELIVSDGSGVGGDSSQSSTSSTTTVPGYKKTYVRTTDDDGGFKLQINLEAYSQDYILVCNFGGDLEHEACSQTVNLTIT